LRAWKADGRLDRYSKIRRDGESEWTAISALPEFSSWFPIREEAEFPPPEDPSILEARVLSSDRMIDAKGNFSRAWQLYRNRFGEVFFPTLLVTLAAGGSGSLPFVGVIVSAVITGILYGGLYWYFLKLIRGQKADLGDAFAGFKHNTVQLMIAGAIIGIVPALVIFVVGLPFWIPFFATVFGSAATETNPGDILNALSILGVVGFVIGALAAVFLYLLWSFAFPLIMDKGLEFWPAMQLSRKVVWKNLGGMLMLCVLSGLVMFAGLLACGIGILFAAPLVFGAFAYTYEDLFSK
jgi:hypothetical protein